MKRVVELFLTIIGIILFIVVSVDHFKLTMIEHPEATERLLWIEHTSRLLAQTAAGGIAMVCIYFGWLKNKV